MVISLRISQKYENVFGFIVAWLESEGKTCIGNNDMFSFAISAGMMYNTP